MDSLCHSHSRPVKRVRSELSLAALCAEREDPIESPRTVGASALADHKPGVYTSTEPAWNNMNLVRLADKLKWGRPCVGVRS